MSTAIHKYPVARLGVWQLGLPEGSKILSAGLDLEKVLCIWALVPVIQHFRAEDTPPSSRVFRIETVYTGESPSVCTHHLATVTGNFVYHIFTDPRT